jgi:hypothetical protein
MSSLAVRVFCCLALGILAISPRLMLGLHSVN